MSGIQMLIPIKGVGKREENRAERTEIEWELGEGEDKRSKKIKK